MTLAQRGAHAGAPRLQYGTFLEQLSRDNARGF